MTLSKAVEPFTLSSGDDHRQLDSASLMCIYDHVCMHSCSCHPGLQQLMMIKADFQYHDKASCLSACCALLCAGKTMLAKAVAHHTTAAFIRVVGSEFVQKYLGEVSM